MGAAGRVKALSQPQPNSAARVIVFVSLSPKVGNNGRGGTWT
jgi:hypothetical protein